MSALLAENSDGAASAAARLPVVVKWGKHRYDSFILPGSTGREILVLVIGKESFVGLGINFSH